MFDGTSRCIELPDGKIEAIGELIDRAKAARSIPRRDYEKLLGKIRHASLGVPGSAGLFTPLNMALRERSWWARLSLEVKEALGDFRVLLKSAAKEPTHVNELVPGTPAFVGYCDACRMGAGGVWLLGTKVVAPIVWRVEWPDDIKADLNSDDNLTGRITNSDLEMAWILLLWLCMEEVCTLEPGCHVELFSDYQPTVSWV